MSDAAVLTAREAAAYLRVGRTFVSEHAHEIGVIRYGRRLRFRRADLDRWLDSHYVRPLSMQPAPPRRRVPEPQPAGINPVTGQPWEHF